MAKRGRLPGRVVNRGGSWAAVIYVGSERVATPEEARSSGRGTTGNETTDLPSRLPPTGRQYRLSRLPHISRRVEWLGQSRGRRWVALCATHLTIDDL